MASTENDDLIDERTALGSVLVDGLGGDDSILGSTFDDSLSGSDGYDTIFGGNGNDEISGGEQRDNLYGGAGEDILSGDAGNDRVYGKLDADTIFGGEGKDILRGNGGDDVVFGGVGNDTIKGQNGADILDGDDDDDYIHAGNGDDIVRGGSGNDELRGGHGDDRVTGGDGDDEIHGGTGKDRIYGGDGDDDIYGGYGKDRIQGGDGDDIIAGGYGGDDILGGDGADSIRGGRGRDTIKGGDGDDIIAGGAHDDTLFGGDGYDVAVYGGSIYDYSWTTSGNKVTVVDNSTRNGDSGTDVLQQIEVLRFNDGEVLLGKTNNAPVVTAENVSVSEGGTVGFTVTGVDFDKDTMSVFDVVYTGSGDYSITGFANTLNSNHSEFVASVSFATSGGFEALAFGESTVEQIVFTLTDGNGGFTSKTVEITITGENDDPVAQAGTVSGDEDTVISGSVAATDVDGDTLTFALATDGTNGSVILAADGSFTYTPGADFNGSDSFTYTVSDGNGGTDTQTVNITVNAVNDAPVAQAAMASGDEDTVISGTVAASDVDGDTLTFSLATDGSNGSVVMAADGSYAYTPDTDFNGIDSFTYMVSDGNGGTDTQTVNIRVDAVNDAPVAQAGTASGDEDTVISGTLLASDVDGDTLRFAVETQATHGTVAIRPDGSYAYTPGADFNGSDSFTYTVSDGNGGTDTQTISITVNAVNDAPVAQAAMASGDEDTVISGTVAASDVDGDTLTFALATDGSNGSVVMAADGSYAYTPDTDFNGTDSFTYTVSDGNGGTDTQTVNIRVDAVNDAPVAQAGTAAGDEDTVISGTLLASDVDGDTLRFAVETQATHGTVAIRPDGTYAYTPGADFNGSDSFTYTVSDGNGGTDTQTVNITVNAVNDAPVAQAAMVSGNEDTVISGTVAASDVDGDTLTFALATDGTNGSVVMAADGSYAYTPDTDFNGTDSFTYTVSDGNGGTDTQTVNIRVDAVNDAPVAQAGAASGDEDTVISGTLLASDVDGDTLRFAVETQATHGTVAIRPDGSYAYTPGADFNGTDSFTYTVSDGNGGTDTQTINITVNAVNDAPVAQAAMASGDEDTVISGTVAASDVDGDTLTFALATDGSNGSVVMAADGSYAYTPDADFNGTDSFTYTVSDGNGGTDTQTVNIRVDAVNDAPVAQAGTASGDEDTVISGSVAATDVDGDTLTFALATNGASGLVVMAANGSFTYTPGANFNGSDSFTYMVSDGNGGTDTQTVNITVNAVNDAPVAQAAMVSGNEDTVISGTVAASDVDGDTLTFALATDGSNGSVVMAADGSYAYTPDTDFNGTDSFTYTVSDGNGGTDTQTVNIRVDAVNDAPVAQAGTASGDEDTVISGTLLASDVDGDTLRFAVETQATHGTVAIRPDGSYAYTPGADFNGSDSFTYTVSDGNGGTDKQTINITVNAVNDAPEGLTAELAVDEDGTITGMLVAQDIDGDSLTFALDTAASNGVVTVSADGSFSYTPTADYFGTDSFAYSVDDGNGGVVSKTVLIDVASVNDAPVQTAPVPDQLVTENGGTASVDLSSFVSDLETANLSFSTVSLVDSSTGRSVAIGTSFTGGVLSFNPSELDLALGDTFDGVFTIRVDDGSGAANSTTQISFNLTVNGSNDPTPINTNNAPVAADLVLRKGDIDPIVIDLKELATDADGGDVLSFGNIVISGSGREGSVTYSLSDGVLTIDPAQFNIEPDETTGVAPEVELEISFDVNDGAGKANSVDTGTILLTIEDGAGPVEEPDTPNNQPVFTNTIVNEAATDRNIVIDLSEYASDADLDDLSFTVSITGGTDLDYELRGTTLHIAYTDTDITGLGAGDSISTEFTVTVDDNTGSANATNTGTVTVNIDGPFTPSPAENRAPEISGPIYGLEVVTDGYDLVTYRESGSDLVEIGRTHVVGTIVTFDLDDFASDADADAISFSDVSVTIGGAEAGGSPNTISSSFDPATNVLTFDIGDLGLSDGEELPVSMNFTVTDDSGAENASTTGSITVAASDPADAAAATTTFDFEEYSSESGNTIPIGGVDGFVFSGSTSVFETDESSSEPERPNPVGLANGQTSFEGNNVLATSVDEAGGKFGIYADTATQRVANDGVFVGGNLPPGLGSAWDPDNYGFEGEFNLENVSINPVSSDNVTIRIVSYRAEIVEVPNGSNYDYYADYVEVDTFDFILDASTVATSIDFSNTLFDDPSVDYDSKFDGINAVEIYALDGSSVVIDDLSLTPV